MVVVNIRGSRGTTACIYLGRIPVLVHIGKQAITSGTPPILSLLKASDFFNGYSVFARSNLIPDMNLIFGVTFPRSSIMFIPISRAVLALLGKKSIPVCLIVTTFTFLDALRMALSIPARRFCVGLNHKYPPFVLASLYHNCKRLQID